MTIDWQKILTRLISKRLRDEADAPPRVAKNYLLEVCRCYFLTSDAGAKGNTFGTCYFRRA